jgi:DNA repair proteins
VSTSASVLIAHNHPSGNPEPSAEDIAITKQIVESGKIIGIPVHDHVIFVDQSYTSMAERSLI